MQEPAGHADSREGVVIELAVDPSEGWCVVRKAKTAVDLAGKLEAIRLVAAVTRAMAPSIGQSDQVVDVDHCSTS